MKKILSLAITVLLFTALVSFSNRVPSEGYKVGDTATDFKLMNIDGKPFSLGDMKEAKGAIVVFTCNHCPFSIAYEDRIISLNAQFAPKGYPVVAINPNDPEAYPDDSFENMKVRANEKGFTFKYLYDETQDVARRFGASRTPHVFVLNRDQDKWVVRYIGAIDDNTDSPAEATKHYVESAVNELLDGKVVTTPFTKAIGCSVKWKK